MRLSKQSSTRETSPATNAITRHVRTSNDMQTLSENCYHSSQGSFSRRMKCLNLWYSLETYNLMCDRLKLYKMETIWPIELRTLY